MDNERQEEIDTLNTLATGQLIALRGRATTASWAKEALVDKSEAAYHNRMGIGSAESLKLWRSILGQLIASIKSVIVVTDFYEFVENAQDQPFPWQFFMGFVKDNEEKCRKRLALLLA
jgi:hypothetical protein